MSPDPGGSIASSAGSGGASLAVSQMLKRLRRRYGTRFTVGAKSSSYIVVTDFGEGG